MCNKIIAPVYVEKSWWILANKSHKIYSQVRVVKGIASKCRHFKFKWKPLLKNIQVGFIYYIYIYAQRTCWSAAAFPDSQHFSGKYVVTSLEDINAAVIIIDIFRNMIYLKNIVSMLSLLYNL